MRYDEITALIRTCCTGEIMWSYDDANNMPSKNAISNLKSIDPSVAGNIFIYELCAAVSQLSECAGVLIVGRKT